MSNAKENYRPAIPLYGIAMSDAISSGDVDEMIKVRNQVLDHISATANMQRLLPDLEKAIQAKKGAIIRPLYAVTIQDAAARGDTQELANIKAELNSYQSLLNHASAAHSAVTPYGVAIQDAKARGDEAEVKRLTDYANSLLAQLNAGK